jgi:hypothetical protein
MSNINNCDICDGSWLGKGWCRHCGQWDSDYWSFWKVDDKNMEDAIKFAKDMQNNPRFK